MVYIREEYVHNEALSFGEQAANSSAVIEDHCYALEKAFSDEMAAQTGVLETASVDAYEGDALCAKISGSAIAAEVSRYDEKCKQLLGGLLKTGVSNTAINLLQ